MSNEKAKQKQTEFLKRLARYVMEERDIYMIIKKYETKYT